MQPIFSDGSCLFSSLGAALRDLVSEFRNTKWAENLRQRIRQSMHEPLWQNKQDPIPKNSEETRRMLISFMKSNLRAKHMFIAENATSCLLESSISEDLSPIQAQPGREAQQKNVIVISDWHTTDSQPFNSIPEYFQVSVELLNVCCCSSIF